MQAAFDCMFEKTLLTCQAGVLHEPLQSIELLTVAVNLPLLGRI